MAKYELEARRRSVDIEKKQVRFKFTCGLAYKRRFVCRCLPQHELDLLNRKFDQLMKQRAGTRLHRPRPPKLAT